MTLKKHYNLLKKNDLVKLKLKVDTLDFDELKKVPGSLNSLESKVDNLEVDKLKPVPIDFKK